ncbi:hypothetical protein D3C73_1000310 [compost metagenome]
MLRITGKIFAELRILCSYTDRTSIQLADTHHDAAYSYERCCRETILFSPQQDSHREITSGKHFTVCLQHDAVT